MVRLPIGPVGEPTSKLSKGRWQDVVFEPVLSVLFPPRCVGCGDFETHLCSSCRATMVEVGADCCPRCGEPGPRPSLGGRCAACMSKAFGFDSARSAFLHSGAARRLVTEFKYGGQRVLGRTMARLALPAFLRHCQGLGTAERVLVTWVPSHRTGLRERGYNQAEVFAKALARGDRPMVTAGLVRKGAVTRHQRGLSKAGRENNLRGVFSLEPRAAEMCDGFDTLLVVDDVFTTGATASEVAVVLARGTGKPVHVFTFSRAVSSAAEGHD